MIIQNKWASSTILSAMLAFVSCAHTSNPVLSTAREVETPAPLPIDEHLPNLASADKQLAIWLDMTRVRHSSLWNPLRTLGLELAGPLISAQDVHWLDTADEILIVSSQNANMGKWQGVLFVKGAIDTSRCRIAADAPDEVRIGDFRGVMQKEILCVPLTERTLLLGTELDVTEAIHGITNSQRALGQTPPFCDVRLDDDMAGIFHLDATRAPLSPEFSTGIVSISPVALSQIQTARFTINFKIGIALNGLAEFADANSAARVVRGIKSDIHAVQNNFIATILNINPLLDNLSAAFAIEGERVITSLSLTEEDIAALNNVVEPLLQIRQMMMRESAETTHQ